MLNFWNNLGPVARHIFTMVATSIITIALTYLTQIGVYKPPVVNVAAPNVSVQFPDGATLKLPAAK